MNFTKPIIAFVFVLLCLFFVGCKKAKDSPFNSNYQNMMREGALIEAAFDDVLKVAENILMNNGNARISTTGAPLGCITEIDTVITGVNQKTYTATFHETCTSYDGKTRRGEIMFDLTGTNYNTPGAILIVTFNNYSFNNNVLHGKMKVTNLGSGKFEIRVSGKDGSGYSSLYLSFLGKTTQWKSFHKRVITSGDADNIIINNVYSIYAPSLTDYYYEGITSDNKHYTARTVNPLVLDYGCRGVGLLRYPIKGSIEYVMEDNNYRTVDYGDNLCDKSVKMTYNSSSEIYDLY